MTSVLILGGSISQLPAIRRAHALGLKVVVVDGDPGAVGFAEADVSGVVDFSDLPSVIAVARRHRVGGVVAISSDRAVPIAAGVAEALGLPGIGSATAQLMTDKGLMRGRLHDAGSPQPPFVVIRRGDDVSAAFAAVGSPAVIKPVDSGGQRGLFLLESEADLALRLDESLAHSRVGRAILERYVPGRELNVIAVVSGGRPRVLTVSDRLRPSGPGFGVGWAHLFPATLSGPVLARAEQVAREAVEALGLRDGIAFPQLLVAGDDVLVVEVAARVAAGQMADLVRHGIGVDLLELAFGQSLGQSIALEDIEETQPKPIAIRFLTAAPGVLPTGRLVSIEGLDQVRAVPGILDAELYLRLGETIRPVQVDADRRGYIIATAESTERALAVADRASRLLRVEVE